jgi:four helix bundle protein
MENQEFSKKLELRTKKFAAEIIRLSATLPNSPEGRVIRNQVSKAGTSIGANYREANRARSRPDFRNKIKICEGEASEAQYWLEIIVELGWMTQDNFQAIYDECTEILAIFTSIGKNT